MIEQTVHPIDDDPVLTIKDIAGRTKLSEAFIYRQVISGNIEHYAFGGSRRKRGAIRFSERQYRQFLSNQVDEIHLTQGIPASSINVADITKTGSHITRTLNQLLNRKQGK